MYLFKFNNFQSNHGKRGNIREFEQFDFQDWTKIMENLKFLVMFGSKIVNPRETAVYESNLYKKNKKIIMSTWKYHEIMIHWSMGVFNIQVTLLSFSLYLGYNFNFAIILEISTQKKKKLVKHQMEGSRSTSGQYINIISWDDVDGSPTWAKDSWRSFLACQFSCYKTDLVP